VLVDVDLTGMMLGMTLLTKPEEVYRALIEAVAYGTRLIIETFNKHKVPIRELIATGGLPDRNKLLMQIYADVTGLPIYIPEATQIGALGSAMHGALRRARLRRLQFDRGSERQNGAAAERKLPPDPRKPHGLQQALRGIRPAARLLWQGHERCHEAPEGVEGGDPFSVRE
jgi:ribulose kinase